MTDAERAQAVEDFGLDFEDDIVPALAAVNMRMKAIEASGIEPVEAPAAP